MGILKRSTTPPSEGTNTISDKEWRGIQTRAQRANPDKIITGRNGPAAAKQGKQNYDQAQRGNN